MMCFKKMPVLSEKMVSQLASWKGQPLWVSFITDYLTNDGPMDIETRLEKLEDLLIGADPERKEAAKEIIAFLKVEAVREKGDRRVDHFLSLKHGSVFQRHGLDYCIIFSGGCTVGIDLECLGWCGIKYDTCSACPKKESVVFVTNNSHEFVLLADRAKDAILSKLERFSILDFHEILRGKWQTADQSVQITSEAQITSNAILKRPIDGKIFGVILTYLGKAVLYEVPHQ